MPDSNPEAQVDFYFSTQAHNHMQLAVLAGSAGECIKGLLEYPSQFDGKPFHYISPAGGPPPQTAFLGLTKVGTGRLQDAELSMDRQAQAKTLKATCS